LIRGVAPVRRLAPGSISLDPEDDSRSDYQSREVLNALQLPSSSLNVTATRSQETELPETSTAKAEGRLLVPPSMAIARSDSTRSDGATGTGLSCSGSESPAIVAQRSVRL
jgi:hypothetical protein